MLQKFQAVRGINVGAEKILCRIGCHVLRMSMIIPCCIFMQHVFFQRLRRPSLSDAVLDELSAAAQALLRAGELRPSFILDLVSSTLHTRLQMPISLPAYYADLLRKIDDCDNVRLLPAYLSK